MFLLKRREYGVSESEKALLGPSISFITSNYLNFQFIKIFPSNNNTRVNNIYVQRVNSKKVFYYIQ